MYKFGNRSLERLSTCDPRLKEVLEEVLKFMDITVLEGHRGKEEQEKVFDKGLSTLRFPYSKHNQWPSLAVDIAPFPIDWEDTGRFGYMAGLVMAIADAKGVKLRWGGDWDGDGELKDHKLIDMPHFEIAE